MINKWTALLLASNILTFCVYGYLRHEQSQRYEKMALDAVKYGYDTEKLGYSFDQVINGWPRYELTFGQYPVSY